MASPWFRMDQLLKCGICSDRFRNPKLLPCNHTFCCDPCLDRLVERSSKQLKCPECSAEHRVPLQGGVQGFPNNVTLVRFLELRQQVSGREPDLPASMQRCNTCKEKGQLEMCAHCNRKVCKDCKVAHVNILRKEIELINEQVRHGLKQLSNVLTQTEENAEKIQKNYSLVKDQIEEVVRRYTKDLLDTESKLKHELELYLKTELRNMRRLEQDLQVELNNVNSNCDLVDKYVNNGVDWTDAELTDYKEIFQRTVDFLRTFDYDSTDGVRKIKFHPHADPDVVHKTLIDFAEVKVQNDQQNSGGVNYTNVNGVSSNIPGGSVNISGPTVTLTPPQSSALARSQSDNRLAAQRRSKLEGRNQPHNDDSDRDSYRRYKDRFARDRDSCERELHREDGSHLSSHWRRELEETRSGIQRGRFSSREILDDADGDSGSPSRDKRSIRFDETPVISQQQVLQVAETEDATKGPLSGVIKILDSPHVMERLHHSEVRQKKLKEEEERKARQPPPAPPPISRPMTRQMSEDEIEKQKKENKAAAAAAATTSTVNTTSTTTTTTNTKSSIGSDYRTTSRSTLSKSDDDNVGRYSSRYSSSLRSSDITTPSTRTRSQQDDSLSKRSQRDETSSPPSRLRSWRTTSSAATDNDTSSSPPTSPTRSRDYQKPPVSPRQRDLPPPPRPPSRSYLGKSSSLDHDNKTPDVSSTASQRRTTFGTGRSTSLDTKDEEDRPRLHLGIQRRTPTIEESSSSSSSDSDSDTDSDAAAKRGDISPSVNTLLARSAQARRQSASTQARLLGRQDDDKNKQSPRSWRDTNKKDNDYLSSARDRLSPRRRTSTSAETTQNDGRDSPYNRLLSERRRSSLASTPKFRDNSPEETTNVSDRLRNGGDSPYSSAAARRNRIARSKSSHDLLPGDDSPEDESLGSIRERLRNRRSTKENSPEDTSNSWSQYLRSKYSSSRAPGGGSSGGTPYGLARSRTSSVLAAPRSGSENSSDDEMAARRRDKSWRGDSGSPRGFNLPRRTYMQKSKPSLKIGSRGTESGFFTWPRGVCVGPDNTIVVADSSNHRIQVFHSTGKFLQEFGSYGSNDGEFDCLAAVTVNRIGQFIVSDRYNHRIQVFDPSGRFIRTFGSEGRSDGRFSYPWGVATDNLGFIYVCDKENHRIQIEDPSVFRKYNMSAAQPIMSSGYPTRMIVDVARFGFHFQFQDLLKFSLQVFQGDGTYVTKFGGIGQRPGELEHPHYIAVSTTNRVIVSDSNNHRIQIFDVNGRLLTTFGSEGSDEAQFKYPRGVAVDDQGYLIVGDSGNNRIQVFHPDGTFLKSFGTWGAADGEFKGLEGVAVTPSGQILVCDRENHRIQVF